MWKYACEITAIQARGYNDVYVLLEREIQIRSEVRQVLEMCWDENSNTACYTRKLPKSNWLFLIIEYWPRLPEQQIKLSFVVDFAINLEIHFIESVVLLFCCLFTSLSIVFGNAVWFHAFYDSFSHFLRHFWQFGRFFNMLDDIIFERKQ